MLDVLLVTLPKFVEVGSRFGTSSCDRLKAFKRIQAQLEIDVLRESEICAGYWRPAGSIRLPGRSRCAGETLAPERRPAAAPRSVTNPAVLNQWSGVCVQPEQMSFGLPL